MTNSATRTGSRAFLLIAFLAACSLALGCANGEIRFGDPFDRELTLEEAQHRYTVLVRWSKFQSAREFVARADRADYMQRMKALKQARFTGHESESIELDDEKQTATIEVVYTMYLPSHPFEVQISETQRWSRDGLTNDWTVDSEFQSLQDVAAN